MNNVFLSMYRLYLYAIQVDSVSTQFRHLFHTHTKCSDARALLIEIIRFNYNRHFALIDKSER